MRASVLLAGLKVATAFMAPQTIRRTVVMSAHSSSLNRRQILKTGVAASVAAGLSFVTTAEPARADGPYTLPDLPYAYDALEPHIDAATMKFHHDKHHLAYVTNANKGVAGKEQLSILDLQKGAIKAGVRNAGGGHYNHSLFWTTLGPDTKSGNPSAKLQAAIDEAFGSTDAMKEKFNAAAAGVFGSGWAWLGVTPGGKLEITATPNQDNPLMEGAACTAMVPILGLDVWEHAYYLKYQNRRPDYIAAFWNVVNWPKVSEYYESYASQGKGVPVQG